MQDYMDVLIQLAAEGGPGAFERSEEFIDKISEEIRQLEKQLEHIENLQAYLKTRITIEVIHPPTDIPKKDRPLRIRGAAMALVERGYKRITAEVIIEQLAKEDVFLNVAQPNAVIGTVLAGSPGFKKIDTNVFEHVGQ